MKYGANAYGKYNGPLYNTIGYNIQFDENNDRKNYTAKLVQFETPNANGEYLKAKKLLVLGEDVTHSNIKVCKNFPYHSQNIVLKVHHDKISQ